MTKRQIYLPGLGGGDCEPTVILTDVLSNKDEQIFGWEQNDVVSTKDESIFGWEQEDTTAAIDRVDLDWERGDFVSVEDGRIFKWNQVDTVSAKDFLEFDWDRPDILGAKDGGLITGLGTPQWRSFNSRTSGSFGGGTFPVPRPTDVVQGDLMVAFLARRNALGDDSNIVIIPSGWTLLHHENEGIENSETYYKLAGASEPDTYNFWHNSGSLIRAEIHRFDGVDQTNPIDVSTSAAHSATTLNPDPPSPSVTTTRPNCLVISFMGHDHLALSQSHTPAADHFERSDYEIVGNGQVEGNHSQSRNYGLPGATGTVVHNCTETVATGATLHRIAIAPGPINIIL